MKIVFCVLNSLNKCSLESLIHYNDVWLLARSPSLTRHHCLGPYMFVRLNSCSIYNELIYRMCKWQLWRLWNQYQIGVATSVRVATIYVGRGYSIPKPKPSRHFWCNIETAGQTLKPVFGTTVLVVAATRELPLGPSGGPIFPLFASQEKR